MVFFALEELTVITNTIQSLEEPTPSEVTEESESNCSLHGTTRGNSNSKNFQKKWIKYNVSWNHLRCVATNDANMIMWGGEKSLDKQIYHANKNAMHLKSMVIDQQAFCKEYLFTMCCWANNQQWTSLALTDLNIISFRKFLSEIIIMCPATQYSSGLSWVKFHYDFFQLWAETKIFLNKEIQPQPQLPNNE